MKIIKKKISFWNSELPLTSKRANYILSRPEESKSLVKAVRASRSSSKVDNKDIIIKFSSQEIAREVATMK
ncbi:hypothetical protein G1K66_12020 [Tenacibaculum finnmarkense]|uniref:hypothetical protein n=1 Tax=Tenacibaculum finnmarkense TaxID=2781243 RepID=UPI001EFBB3AD|nr:hypothetical protein [Tenacibaculum finnmarkense]MCG8813981.1 hypothetical protein [Tenacibaculum finnmarkense]